MTPDEQKRILPTYREAQRIISAARPSWASSSRYSFDGLPAESGGDREFFGLQELARCGAESGGRWCVYVVARRDSYRANEGAGCIADHFYVDFGPMTTAGRVRYFLDCAMER